MAQNNDANQRDHASVATRIAPYDGRGKSWNIPPDEGKSPRLRMRTIERTAIVRFVDAEIFFEQAAVRAVSQQLHQLIRDEAHIRLVVNFAGVKYLPSEVLGILAALEGEVDPAQGRITFCGLDPCCGTCCRSPDWRGIRRLQRRSGGARLDRPGDEWEDRS